MLLQKVLELFVVVLDDLQFLLGEHFCDVVEVTLDALDHTQHFLLQVLLPLLRLLQLHLKLLQLGRHLQSEDLLPQPWEYLCLGTDEVLLAVGECAAETDALAAAEADVGGFVEVQRALARVVPHGGLLRLARGEQAGRRQSLRLAGRLLGRTVGFARLVPHSDYNNVPLGTPFLLRLQSPPPHHRNCSFPQNNKDIDALWRLGIVLLAIRQCLRPFIMQYPLDCFRSNLFLMFSAYILNSFALSLNMLTPLPPTHSMRKPKIDRRALKRIISDLVRRRQEHEQRINKLLDPNYHHQDATKSSPRAAYQEFSEVLRKLEGEEPQTLHESIGGLGHHVNLLATVSLKTDYFLTEKQHPTEEGQLYSSLVDAYGKRPIRYEFDGQQPQSAPEWLRTLVGFLLEEELVSGLFLLEGSKGRYDFIGARFQHGKYEEIMLSKEPLSEAERHLILASKKQQQGVNISWLLLARLLKPIETLNFPLAVHRLFSFPYKKYAIGESLQLINFTQLMAQRQEEECLKLYGIDPSSCSHEITLPKGNSFSNYKPLILRYPSVLLMNQTEFPVKSLPLSCLKNHFVVVTLVLKGEGQYYITVGGETTNMRFKLCLLDFQGSLIQSETVNSGQFMLAALREQQYELYISPESGTEAVLLGEEESFELVRESQEQFWLWVQGSSVCTRQGDLEMEIRLKEQYNSYTLKIAQEYIRQQESSVPQGYKLEAGCIAVRRYVLSGLELVVDQFCSPQQGKIAVKYAQANLCDEFFQDTIATIAANDTVVLRKQTPIESIQPAQGNSPISFKVFTYFL